MTKHRVIIVGNSLFADAIVQMLQHGDVVQVIGTASSLEATVTWLEVNRPDAIIVAGTTSEDTNAIFGSLIANYPQLPVIRTTLNAHKIQVATSRCIRADMPDLLNAITTLPKQMGLDHDASL
jgi:DNA-binding NarL/FixJ family response regulator